MGWPSQFKSPSPMAHKDAYSPSQNNQRCRGKGGKGRMMKREGGSAVAGYLCGKGVSSVRLEKNFTDIQRFEV